ncbi:HD domain-containing protein [Humidesulfovibrio mexicanus]|uniref:HD domain-containing protein n=1 Tax=Humidesulfovibrio mexicanus TaxID=147047 RepID=A0A239AVU0_9BACT|nr:HD domain-containing protein [Humidesulfovibrio mexicanus]SNR99825.1 HD domain-containing protein [Humidesulfovibrio mexicanus]
MNIITDAMDFATQAHRGQKRKYTGEPYIVHPFAVAGLVRSVVEAEEAIAAAFLHDTVEDCGVPFIVLADRFGRFVADLVEMLTDPSRPEDGNRAMRKRIDLGHTTQACPVAKTIKLADLIDNTKSIVAFDPKFAAVYLEEKRRLLEVLREGDAGLWAIAKELAA